VSRTNIQGSDVVTQLCKAKEVPGVGNQLQPTSCYVDGWERIRN
ncbi:hypothetical protein DBR06_SOUSAS3110072, partial [Sousa chinensis]